MSRKDYKAIVAALVAAHEWLADDKSFSQAEIACATYGVYRAAIELSDVLKEDNIRFDRTKFMEAFMNATGRA